MQAFFCARRKKLRGRSRGAVKKQRRRKVGSTQVEGYECALAQQYERYGAGMINLKLRQAGLSVNYQRVERLYQEAKMRVRRRKREKVPVGERHVATAQLGQ